MADDGYLFPVDLTSIMLFASSLGETNRAYYDEQYAEEHGLGGVIMPPTFPSASSHWNPKHGLRGVRQIPAPPPEKPKEKRGEDAGGGGGSVARLLHGEQRFIYHKPVHPGMRLTVTSKPGKSWEKEGKRGGTMKFNETVSEYRDENGELVITAIGVGIITGQVVEG
jgi:acyl dehydratase